MIDAATIDGLGRPRLLVLGDLMLDRYVWGEAERVSPEAPILVLRADDEEIRLGGAAGVCGLLAGLDCDVVACGVIGDDAAGRQLLNLLIDSGCEPAGVVVEADRPTTHKERILGRAPCRVPQQIVRIDREVRRPISPAVQERILATVQTRLDECDAVLISDYDKGGCPPDLLQSVIAAARRRGRPVLVDPARIADYERYRGADVVKPNRVEAELATGSPIRSPGVAAAVGRTLRERFGVHAVVLTLDGDGMVLVDGHGGTAAFPVETHAVCDVTGAGDAALAGLGLGVAGGLGLPAAVALANALAGLEVQKLGAAPVSRRELRASFDAAQPRHVEKIVSLAVAVEWAASLRRRGGRLVFTNGCFDVLHAGHLTLLRRAAALGDALVVGLNNDASVRGLKGPARPIVGEQDRAAALAALPEVALVVIFDDATPLELLQRLRPDVLVKGGDYMLDQVVGGDFVAGYGGRVRVLPLVEGFSTTQLLARAASRSEPVPADRPIEKE